MAKRNKVQELIANLEEGYANQEKELEAIIQRNQKAVLDLNKQQLFKGEDSEGKSLGRYRSKAYAAFKLLLNPLGVVDLFVTGRFYSKFFLKRNKFPIQIDSTDSKRDELVQKYTDKIFNLNEESKAILVKDWVKREYIDYWRKILRLR